MWFIKHLGQLSEELFKRIDPWAPELLVRLSEVGAQKSLLCINAQVLLCPLNLRSSTQYKEKHREELSSLNCDQGCPQKQDPSDQPLGQAGQSLP